MNVPLVLLEKPTGDGLGLQDVIMLLGKINHENFLPIEIDAGKHESSAFGFISISLADELNYDYDGSGLTEFVQNILDDSDNETLNGLYYFKGHTIYLTR